MDDNILHGSGGAKDPTTKSTRTDAPVLQSLAANRAARLEYRDLLIGWANEMGYGSIYRNEVPAVLRKSLPIDIDTELPIITDDGVSRDRREQRLDERRKAERVNRERRVVL
eukprot:scaffold174_cov99-Isochrysis_galbana.AAC.6